MDLGKLPWSPSEKAIARRAFQQALDRELADVMSEVMRRANKIQESSELWKLESYLARRRKNINEKYDYRYSVLIGVFARLIHEGLISEADLQGLDQDKLTRIRLVISCLQCE